MNRRHLRRNIVRIMSGLFLIASLAKGAPDVLTYHNDNARTGLNSAEVVLTPQSVKNNFGFLFNMLVDGKVDAQPLYVSHVNILGTGFRNILYVATENDSVYAFDADTGTKYKQVSMLKSGENPSDSRGCSQVTPIIGITATPVIDRSSGPNGTIYLVAMSKDSSSQYHQRLHALDLTTLAEEFSGPVDIAAVIHNQGSSGPEHQANGDVVFNPAQYKERASLVLVNGIIYTTWASHCDIAPYTAWVMGYNESTLAQATVFNANPKGLPTSSFLDDGSGSAFWNSGAGPAADDQGNLYAISGNGPFDPNLTPTGFPSNGDYGDALIKFSTSSGLAVTDYFTPWNQQADANGDTDFGSGGVMLIPDTMDSNHNVHQLAVGAGKDANLYVVDRGNMGKYNKTSQSNLIYQQLSGALSGGEWATAAYFNGSVYYGPVGNHLLAFTFDSNARLSTSPTSSSSNTFPYPGATPSISSNGNINGVVWALENTNPAKLDAYDATSLATRLFTSTNTIGNGNKFVTPTIVNGKVYVPTQNSVAAFGLTSLPAPFSTWQSANFTTSQLNDPTISGPLADPDKDGLSNLLEYALGSPPLGASNQAKPLVGTMSQNGNTYLTIQYTQSKSAVDVTLAAQVSSDLVTWQGGSGAVATTGTVDNGLTQTVTVRDLTAIGAVGNKRFIRLQVTH